jgi:hypothetical protein
MAFYSISARGDSGLKEDLNRFLRSHRVLTVHRESVGQGDNSFLALVGTTTPTTAGLPFATTTTTRTTPTTT